MAFVAVQNNVKSTSLKRINFFPFLPLKREKTTHKAKLFCLRHLQQNKFEAILSDLDVEFK